MNESLGIPGAWVFRPLLHEDPRGVFLEAYTTEGMQAIGREDFHVAQINVSVSRQGVVRGVHAYTNPPGQAKFVTCISGSILDCVVDLRPGSSTFGAWDSVELNDRTREAVFLSEGLGHAFQVLSPAASVVYACNMQYQPSYEVTVSPMDQELQLPWFRDASVILSVRDRDAPTLLEFRHGLDR